MGGTDRNSISTRRNILFGIFFLSSCLQYFALRESTLDTNENESFDIEKRRAAVLTKDGTYNMTTTYCNLEKRKISSLSLKTFREVYAGKKPVILVEDDFGSNGGRNHYFRNVTKRSNLLKHYGSMPITLSTANSYTKEKKVVTVKEYLFDFMDRQTVDVDGANSWYWFGDNYATEKPILELFSITQYAGRKMNTPSFGVGGELSGVPFHCKCLPFQDPCFHLVTC